MSIALGRDGGKALRAEFRDEKEGSHTRNSTLRSIRSNLSSGSMGPAILYFILQLYITGEAGKLRDQGNSDFLPECQSGIIDARNAALMDATAFWKTVVMDRTDFLERLIALLNRYSIRYCVVGGQAVNAYAEPVVSLDLDLAVAAEQIGQLKSALEKEFHLKSFGHSLNVSAPESDLRVQIQTDPRYAGFVGRAEQRTILGLRLPVARPEDVLQGKVWAVQDPTRRSSKRQKDLADISRLLEVHPDLRSSVPEEVLSRLF